MNALTGRKKRKKKEVCERERGGKCTYSNALAPGTSLSALSYLCLYACELLTSPALSRAEHMCKQSSFSWFVILESMMMGKKGI